MSEGDEQRLAKHTQRIVSWLKRKFPACEVKEPVDVEDGVWRSFSVRPTGGVLRLRVRRDDLTDDWKSPAAIVNALDAHEVAARMKSVGLGYVEFWWDGEQWEFFEVEPDESN